MPEKNVDSVYLDDQSVYGKRVIPTPKPEKNIGIDTKQDFFNNILDAGERSLIDLQKFNNFLSFAQDRDSIYSMIDTMSEDSTIAAILRTYAEDCTEMNSQGRIVWVDSPDPYVAKYVQFLLDSINVDKKIYKWAHSLCKYGDLYLRLYRESEFKDDLFVNDKHLSDDRQQLNESTLAEILDIDVEKEKSNSINEDINLKIYKANDKYAHYVEMVPNPAEMFELTKFGKTYAYIYAPVNTMQKINALSNSYFRYQFNRGDVDVYDATNFVHAALQDNSPRVPEQVEIFTSEDGQPLTYTVNKGQSILQDTFKIWREMMLLENSMLLNRLTKSSIVRLINVEVGDMPKEKVGSHLLKIKQLMEQKTSINDGVSMSEYTNPGPVENNIYIPTHGGIGNITTAEIGGDTNVAGLADVDYFRDKLFGALQIPKQFFGFTDDGAGFNGGQSLTIISASYAKAILRIQNALIQAITDAINIMLIDKDLHNYVNKFTIHMLPPMTQNQLDRNDSVDKQIQQVNDVMGLLGDIDNPIAKLEILKNLLTNVINNPEVISIIQSEIDRLKEEQEGTEEEGSVEDEFSMMDDEELPDIPNRPSRPRSASPDFDREITNELETNNEPTQSDTGLESPAENSFETVLPTPAELNIGDVGNSNNPNL